MDRAVELGMRPSSPTATSASASSTGARASARPSARAPHHRDDDVPRDGHAVLVGAGRGGDEGIGMSIVRSCCHPRPFQPRGGDKFRSAEVYAAITKSCRLPALFGPGTPTPPSALLSSREDIMLKQPCCSRLCWHWAGDDHRPALAQTPGVTSHGDQDRQYQSVQRTRSRPTGRSGNPSPPTS